MGDVAIHPVTPDQHDAVMHYFDLVAYADNPNWSRCFCMERLVDDYPSRTKEQNRASRSELLRSAKANGLVAYRLGRVVGWCHAAPKSELKSVPGEATSDVGRSCASSSPRSAPSGHRDTAARCGGRALAVPRMKTARGVSACPRRRTRTVGLVPVRRSAIYVPKAGFEIAETHEEFCIVQKKL